MYVHVYYIITLLLSVYRPDWATSANTKEMCDYIDTIASRYKSIIIAGDFNLPGMKWANLSQPDSGNESRLRHLISEHHLQQVVKQPTRDSAILDLIFVSQSLSYNDVEHLPPIAGSDHDAQLLNFHLPCTAQHASLHRHVNYDQLRCLLSQVDWARVFNGCITADDYADTFTELLSNAITDCSRYTPALKRQRLPRYIVSLLRKKKRAWAAFKRTGDKAAFNFASKTARAALRQHRRCMEMRLIYANDKKAFFSHIRRSNASHGSVQLCVNSTALSNNDSANALLSTFSSNFTSPVNAPPPCDVTSHDTHEPFRFNCTVAMVMEALHLCPNKASCPDGISFNLLKEISGLIASPLNTVFQHSLFEGIFPKAWKHAVVIPLYKGKGQRGSPENYRPISLCQCLGKMLERIVHDQLVRYIGENNLLYGSQHGFRAGRSTMTNLLDCEAKIAEIISDGHPYDIISFDFAKAFDKAPHDKVVNAIAALGIIGRALEWLSSFLAGRTFSVRVGDSLSPTADVTSGVIQGSTLGPVLYDIFIDSLLRKIKLPSQAFADDFKFIADVIAQPRVVIQAEVDIIVTWADDHGTPLSIDKCSVLHCGKNQPNNDYYIKSAALKSVDRVVDLGVERSADATYSAHCARVVAKATRVCGMIRHVFRTNNRKLLWPAFISYVLPILTYCSPVWSPFLVRDITAIEKVQRRYTKKISGLSHLSYNDRLRELHALSLSQRRQYTDMVTTYKYLHGLTDCAASDVGLELATAPTRGRGLRLFQHRPINRVCANLFPYRATSSWNKLPMSVINTASLASFTRAAFKHYFITM